MRHTDNNWLRLEQLDRRMHIWRQTLSQAPPPKKGWVHTIRKALGMTQQQLADRMGVHVSRIGPIEHGEVEGTITLATLNQVAQALGCRYVIGFIPEGPLQDRVKQQASKAATELIEGVDHTMRLEEQATDRSSQNREIERVRDGLLQGKWSKLWS